MKKLLSLILLVSFAAIARAQTVSFLLTAAPCHNDGVLDATFAGLTPPLTVKWYTYGTSGTVIIHTGVSGLTDALTGYSGGEITINAIDALGVTDSGAYAGHPPFTICPFMALPGLCPAPDTLSASICSGGTTAFTYQWYNIATTAIVGTGNPITVLPGIYGVNVTDGLGCTFGSSVSNISAFAASIPGFSDSISTTIANCTDGTATVVTYGGGAAPFSYLWSNGATSPTLGGLVMGTYSVTITDANGCNASNSAEIFQAISVSAPVVATPASCAASNGTVTAFGSGGTPPYSYVWSNGATTSSQSGLSSGFYGVNITDANGCVGSDGGFVGSSTPITVAYSATPSLCTVPNGTATLSITGGTGSYSVAWYTSPAQSGFTAHTLTYGTYAFHVTDGAGCTQDGTVYVPPIDVISVSFSSSPAVCTLSNGSLTAYPTGGVAPYSYSWSTGATTASISSRPEGSYGVTITDHAGCKVSKEQYLPGTSPLGVGISNTPASCIFTNDGVDNATAWGGTTPYTYAWSSGGTTATISALPYGPYWLTVTDASGCASTNNYSYVGYNYAATDCYCTISGVVYQDLNGNCTQDPGEPGIPNIQIYVSGMGYTYTDGTGTYSMKVPSGSYTVSETIQAFYPLSGCQVNNIPVTVSASASCVHTVNFANNVIQIHDMHISNWDYDLPRPVPGHNYSHVTIVSNDGTVAEDSILVKYNPDGQIFAPTFTPGSIFTGVPYSYNTAGTFPTLSPGAAQEFFMSYNVPTNIAVGTALVFMDSVAYKGPIENWTTDYSPWNNINYFTTTIVGSSNPNFKEVSPKGTGPAGVIAYSDSVLEYMVHFQNTGNSSAENVIVVDTLDDNLNWTSMRPVFESAPCKVTLSQNGTKKVATFTFSGINLPTKASDEMRSNGMFTYTVKLNSGLPSGAQIRNNASIYFDYNAPVKTNTTLNTIGAVAPQGVTTVSQSASSFTIYPNPANQSFNALINSNGTDAAQIIVSDVTGKTMMNNTINLQKGSQTVSTDVSHLAPGVYFVTLNENGKRQTQKLVIIK